MLTTSAARTYLRHFRQWPKALARPVVVLSGWGDPGVVAAQVARDIRRATGDVRVADISFFWQFTMHHCRARVVERVQALWPSTDAHETVEVDVVAHSMGGLVARFAALADGTPGFDADHAPKGRRLKIRMLHTVGTPHQGANQAKLFEKWDARAKAMMKDSAFLTALNAALPAHAIVPYAIEGDWVVGLENAAPHGHELRRFTRRLLRPSHAGATTDPRILLEIVKHLRGDGRP